MVWLMDVDLLVWICAINVIAVAVGCSSLDSSANYDAVRAKSISVAAAHYVPADDGKGDETYNVILRNAGSTSSARSLGEVWRRRIWYNTRHGEAAREQAQHGV